MIVGIGVDIVQIDRFIPWTENQDLMKRFFSEGELQCLENRVDMAQALAVRFAAKEAFGKALGTGLRTLVLKDIQVQQDELGKPHLGLSGSAKKALQESGATVVHVSLSHDGNYGIAYVVLEGQASEEKYAENKQKKR